MSRAFRLASLLRLRGMAEDHAAVELAAATRRRDEAERRRLDTEVMLGNAALPARADELHWRAAIASRTALSGLLLEHGTRVARAQDDVDGAQDVWSQARTATRTLEKLEERHDAEVRSEDERAEQAVLDEVAGRRRPAGADGGSR